MVSSAVAQTHQLYYARGDAQGDADVRGGISARFSQLRQFADQCDAARFCINERKRQIQATEFVISPREGYEDSSEAQAQVEAARQFINTDGGLGGPGVRFQEFLSITMEDYLVCGCIALYRRPTRGGGTYSVEPVDAATIKPLLTEGGFVPSTGDAYEQYINGKRVAGFSAREMRYLRYDPRSNSRWSKSPTDYALQAILQYLGYDSLNLAWVTDGDMERSYWRTPEEWTREQAEAFVDYLRAMNETWARRNESPVIPGATLVQTRPRSEANSIESQVHLLKRVAAAYDVNASVLGFAGETYKVAQEEQIRLAQLKSEMPTLLAYEQLLNDIFREDCGLDLVQGRWNLNIENRQLMAEIVATAGPGVFTPNEARQLCGLEPAEGQYVDCLTRREIDGSLTVLGWTKGATPPAPEPPPAPTPVPEAASPEPLGKALTRDALTALDKWRRKALRYQREGNLARCRFESQAIPSDIASAVTERLAKARTPEEVRAAFEFENAKPPTAAHLAEALETIVAAAREERGSRAGW